MTQTTKKTTTSRPHSHARRRIRSVATNPEVHRGMGGTMSVKSETELRRKRWVGGLSCLIGCWKGRQPRTKGKNLATKDKFVGNSHRNKKNSQREIQERTTYTQ